jgi:hypothetical protein
VYFTLVPLGKTPKTFPSVSCRVTSVFPIESGNRVLDLAELMPTDLPGPEERVQRDERVAERLRSLSELKPDERRALALLVRAELRGDLRLP